jgi:hypothetical protein
MSCGIIFLSVDLYCFPLFFIISPICFFVIVAVRAKDAGHRANGYFDNCPASFTPKLYFLFIFFDVIISKPVLKKNNPAKKIKTSVMSSCHRKTAIKARIIDNKSY